ncbi:MAG: hypothetical protein F6J93_25715 [Oscillatoria sp. SIO1A7]|nr:hypothetical protein [Oscillatoria sp. SIO1A7]
MIKLRNVLLTLIFIALFCIAIIFSNAGFVKANIVIDCGGFVSISENGCDKIPTVRGNNETNIFFPQQKIYNKSIPEFPEFSQKVVVAKNQSLTVDRIEFSSGIISQDLSTTPFEALVFEKLPSGRYSFLSDQATSDFYIPSIKEIEEIKKNINILRSEALNSDKLKTSIAFLLLDNQYFSSVLSLLEKDLSFISAGNLENNLILAYSIDNILPISPIKHKLIWDLAEKVLLNEVATEKQRQEAILLVKNN